MIGLLFNSASTVLGMIFVLAWARRRLDQQEARHRLEMERLVLELRRLAGEPKPPIPLEPGMTVEDPPVLALEEPPHPLPVARALKP